MKLKIDHVQISVTNLEKSLDWYEKVFGFRHVEDGVLAKKIRWAISANSDFMICMHEIKRKNAKEGPDFYGQEFHAIKHFGIRITDLPAWERKIKQNNLETYFIEYPNSKSWYISDPDGNEIEVNYTESPTLKFPTLKNSILKR